MSWTRPERLRRGTCRASLVRARKVPLFIAQSTLRVARASVREGLGVRTREMACPLTWTKTSSERSCVPGLSARWTWSASCWVMPVALS